MAASVVLSACQSASAPPSAPPSAPTSVPFERTSPTNDSGSAAEVPDAQSGWWRVQEDPVAQASDLSAPWSVVALGDVPAASDSAVPPAMLISERGTGRVLELASSGRLREVGVVPEVVSGGESGLHGLALWADVQTSWLYAYLGAVSDNRVVRMPLQGDAGTLSLGEAEAVLTGIPRANFHNGGRLAFGPDGYLYVATGDALQPQNAQNSESLGGKILRITPEGAPAPDNPSGTAVYSSGHRNVQGLAWTGDGTLWATEFGQNDWDELNRIEPGANYGWPLVEGRANDGRFVDPVVQWRPADASPSGLAAVGDTLFIASLRGERLWQVDVRGGETASEPVATWIGAQGRLRDVLTTSEGNLWVLTNNTDGRGRSRAGDDLLLQVRVSRV